MESEPKTTRLAPLIFFTGDLIALLLFVFIGQHDHSIDDPQPLVRLIITTAFFALPWTITALFLGAYQRGTTTMRRHIGLVVNCWLISAPLGALLLSFANGTGVILSPFLIVAILAGGTLLLAWRVAFSLFQKRRA